MSKLGYELYTAINSGTIASPTWNSVPLIRDESLTLSRAAVDITTRLANGWRITRGGLREATVELQLLYVPNDTDMEVFRAAYFAEDSQVILGLFDGDVSVTGTYYGLHAAMQVTGFSQPRNLEDATVVDVSLAMDLEASTNTAPAWVTITTA